MGLQLETLVDGFQDVIDHKGDKRKVLICGRNMHRMRTDGKSIVQLVFNSIDFYQLALTLR